MLTLQAHKNTLPHQTCVITRQATLTFVKFKLKPSRPIPTKKKTKKKKI